MAVCNQNAPHISQAIQSALGILPSLLPGRALSGSFSPFPGLSSKERGGVPVSWARSLGPGAGKEKQPAEKPRGLECVVLSTKAAQSASLFIAPVWSKGEAPFGHQIQRMAQENAFCVPKLFYLWQYQ